MPKKYKALIDGNEIVINDPSEVLPGTELTELWVVPEQVTLWQLRGVLAVMNLEDTVTAVINGMPDGNEKIIAIRAWEKANNIRRKSPTVEAIKAILNLTDEQVDQIFIQAEQIDA